MTVFRQQKSEEKDEMQHDSLYSALLHPTSYMSAYWQEGRIT